MKQSFKGNKNNLSVSTIMYKLRDLVDEIVKNCSKTKHKQSFTDNLIHSQEERTLPIKRVDYLLKHHCHEIIL